MTSILIPAIGLARFAGFGRCARETLSLASILSLRSKPLGSNPLSGDYRALVAGGSPRKPGSLLFVLSFALRSKLAGD
jgi:hypothetical protein